MLAAKGRVVFQPSPREWFDALLSQPGILLAPLTPEAAIESSYLPTAYSGDPADRLLIATARRLQLAIVTRDRHILDYAAKGQVRALAC